MKLNSLKLWTLITAAALMLAACNMPDGQQTTTPALNITLAYQTVEARLTEISLQTPAATSTPVPTESGIEPSVTSAPATTQPAAPTSTQPPASTATQAVPCDQAAAGTPIDVTIPDDTVFQADQAFTKVWRLRNVGTCTWSTAYAVVFFSGEQMSAPGSVNLPASVSPGQSVDISVDMVAPQTPGNYQGNWKLRNAENVLFGIGPNSSSPFWVRIVVVQTPTATSTAPAGTATPTATATQATILASGPNSLVSGDTINLDSNQLNSGGGDDISYETNANGQHLLVPLGSTVIGVFGGSQPSFQDCKTAAMSGSSLAAEDLSAGVYLCYRTNQGLPGWMHLVNFNIDTFNLGIEITTWSIP